MKTTHVFPILICNLLYTSSNEVEIPQTLKQYRNLSEQQKQKLRKRAESEPHNTELGYPTHLLCDLEYRQMLYTICKIINKKLPNEHLYCLGQSPAYICKAASFIDQIKKRHNRFSHIAFSGKWYDSKKNAFTRKNQAAPPQEAQKAYHAYLEKLALSPTEIIKRYNEQNKKTVLIEYTLSAESLYSFLEVLKEAATKKQVDDMKKAFSVFMLQGSSAGCYEKDMQEMHDFKVEKHLLKGKYDEFMLKLSRADAYDDRLVPSYPHKDWRSKEKNPQNFALSTNAKLLQFLLIDDAYEAKQK